MHFTTIDNVHVTRFVPDTILADDKYTTVVYFHGGGWTWLSVGNIHVYSSDKIGCFATVCLLSICYFFLVLSNLAIVANKRFYLVRILEKAHNFMLKVRILA